MKNVHVYLFILVVFLFLVCEILLENNKPSHIHVNICYCNLKIRYNTYISVITYVYLCCVSCVFLFHNDILSSSRLDLCMWNKFPLSHVS